MQGDITITGSSKGREVNLTGDLIVRGGNPVNPQITTNGFAFHRVGVLRAPVIDGSRDPAAWAANITFDGEVHTHWIIYGQYPLAVEILESIQAKSRDEGAAMWSKTLDEIFANPGTSYGDLVTVVDAWAKTDPGGDEGVTNTLDIDSSFKRLQAKFFAGQTFNQIKTELLSKPRETWDGAETEVVEEYGDGV